MVRVGGKGNRWNGRPSRGLEVKYCRKARPVKFGIIRKKALVLEGSVFKCKGEESIPTEYIVQVNSRY